MKTHINIVTVLIFFVLTACSPSDADIKKAVESALKSTPELNSVMVEVDKGVVRLTGEVPSEEMKKNAQDLISNVSGLKEVNNSIAVVPPGPTPEELAQKADDNLKQKVMENFQTYEVEGVNVSVSNGTVVLTGEVKRDNLEQVMQAAMESGAAKVDNQLTIVD
ncbi:BON domain-containing protein [Marinigracilibium pacificum]|uniref:BON domain-containing protein n=1 Tax=Marinigracilibium pacificum TaxID=2729599 RepID=A0A848ISV6_9BACT|nr:BON domain-containing protein [Marinigracilibium pacificum]NMM47407.1 BON domain-containing protein [Marinigracilibium pacificum]